jgi:hypothetical protein
MGLFLFLFFSACAQAASFLPGSAEACAHFYRALGEEAEILDGRFGDHFFLPALSDGRSLDSIKEFRFGAYNVLDMQSSIGRLVKRGGEFVRQLDPHVKPIGDREEIAAEILGRNADFLFLEEVEGLGSLAEFNRKHLNRAYRPVIIKGNDTGGIELAMLVKADFPLDLEIVSHAEMKLKNNEKEIPLFSRDAPLVIMRKEGEDRPLLALVGAHLKSQRDIPGDPKSVKRRGLQAKASVQIIRAIQKKYPGLPVLMAGDFNADLRTGKEFHSFWSAGMKDSFDLAPKKVPKEKRITQSYHPKGSPAPPPQYMQLDSILLDPEAVKLGIVKQAEIVPHVDEEGMPKPLPKTMEQRLENPSDHFMVFGVFDFEKIKQHWRNSF